LKHAREDYDRIQDPEGKIPDDEPVFLLRGQDVLAPIALETYANECERYGLMSLAKITREHLNKMRALPHRKMPDL
jgi:hypothetical protein